MGRSPSVRPFSIVIELARRWGLVRKPRDNRAQRTHPQARGAATAANRPRMQGSDRGVLSVRVPSSLIARRSRAVAAVR